eukprot:2799178-Rhodomonas_salina.5
MPVQGTSNFPTHRSRQAGTTLCRQLLLWRQRQTHSKRGHKNKNLQGPWTIGANPQSDQRLHTTSLYFTAWSGLTKTGTEPST